MCGGSRLDITRTGDKEGAGSRPVFDTACFWWRLIG